MYHTFLCELVRLCEFRLRFSSRCRELLQLTFRVAWVRVQASLHTTALGEVSQLLVAARRVVQQALQVGAGVATDWGGGSFRAQS